MTGAVLAVALLLGGAQTHQLVQALEKLDQGSVSQDGFVHRWIGRALGGFAGQVASQVLNLQVKRSPSSDATVAAADAKSAKPDDADDDDDDDKADADNGDDDSPVHVDVQVSGNTKSIVISQPKRPPGEAASTTTNISPGRNGSISQHIRGGSTVEILHNIASDAGWSLTLAGVGRDKIDVDFDSFDPTEALRQVLIKANCMGVLRGDKLVVIPAAPGTSGHSAGLLIEQRGDETSQQRSRSHHSGDLVKVFGDVVVTSGTVVQGDAVAILGSVELESGAVVQGSVAAIGGSVSVQNGAVVLGDSVSLLGTTDVERGGQVLGDHVQVGLGPLFSSAPVRHRSFLSRIGPFGLFPTLALFASVYLIGLLALRLWPERMRATGATLVETPMRSFVIGFLCWLLFLPLLLLLLVSVVGILLVPLLPLAVGLSVMIGACALALKIGEALPAGQGQRFVPPAALAMGLTTMLLVSLVPWIGAPLLVLVLFVAPGAVISSRFGRSLPGA